MNDSQRRKVETDLGRLRVFSHELGLLRGQLDGRLNELRKIQAEGGQGPDGPIEWDFIYSRFGGRRTDPGANLAVKAFFFVAKQAVDKSLHIMFVLRNELGNPKAAYSLPNGARPSGFGKVFRALMEGDLEYDQDVLQALRKHRDKFIIVRLCRNLLKSVGTFDVQMLNGEATIVVPVLARTRQDPTLAYLEQLAVPVPELRTLRFDPPFLEDCHRVLTGFGMLLEEKWKKLVEESDTKESS